MRFVEGDGSAAGRRAAPLDESRKDFWDDFADIGEQRAAAAASSGGGSGSAIGTAAMGKGRKKEDEWDW